MATRRHAANPPRREPLRRLERALPARWFGDPAHHARELRAIWQANWIAVARESELAMPGDWQRVDLAGESLVLARGEDGRMRAFHNVCRHRGSVLCTGAQGRFERHRIVCPYHAWTYALDGRLVATPRRMPTPDFDAADFPLHAAACDIWGGWVFVNLARRPRPLAEALGALPAAYANIEFERLMAGHRIELEVRANWKILAENFAECYHCPPVHPEFCRIVTAYRQAGAWGLGRDADGEPLPGRAPEYAAGARTLTLDGTATLPPFRRLDEAERARLYAAEMVKPNLFLNIHPDYVNAHLMFPTGPDSVRMVYEWLFAPEAFVTPGFDVMHYVKLWDLTNRQDARNCEWQQAGMRSRAFAHGWYMPQEFDAARFTRWVKSELRRAGPAARPGRRR